MANLTEIEEHKPHLLKGVNMAAQYQITSTSGTTSPPPPGADTPPSFSTGMSSTQVNLGSETQKWNNQWRVEDAVNAFNGNLMYGYSSVVTSCEILYQAGMQWTDKNVTQHAQTKTTKRKDKKTGEIKEHLKTFEVTKSDYDRLLESLGFDNPKGNRVVQRMETIYKSFAGLDDDRVLMQLELAVGHKDNANLVLPSTYSVLYEIATCDNVYLAQLKEELLTKGLDITAGDIRSIKNPKLDDEEDEDKFKIEKGEKLVVKGYIAREVYEANEKAISAALKSLQSAGVHCDIPDYKKERKAEDQRKKKSADNQAYNSLRQKILKDPNIKGYDTLPESVRKRIEEGTPIKDEDGEPTGDYKPYGMTTARVNRCIEKSLYERDEKYKKNAQQDDARMKEISANTANLKASVRTAQGVAA
jgi:hypothetical protein|tara:strand:+ start:366 stop:1613 length:1248 start_codon:yes stop_codon:yes gene_type:complete